MKIRFVLNGREQTLETPSDRRVVDLLREDLGLTGTKESCGTGECGACGILVDGESRLSCLMLAAQLEGRRVVTIEGIAADPDYAGLLDALVRHGAVQCGYCAPGMVVAAVDLLGHDSAPQRNEIRAAISGNLCRCTGYQKIIDAVADAVGQAFQPDAAANSGEERHHG
jgi:aerobic-type carbon monoxide dehydrogenase small subunit (CoxS/CutS family)